MRLRDDPGLAQWQSAALDAATAAAPNCSDRQTKVLHLGKTLGA